MKKLFPLILGITLLLPTMVIFAQNQIIPPIDTSISAPNTTLTACAPGAEDCYTLLEPLPFSEGTPLTSIDTSATGGKGLGGFINFMFEVGIGIAGVLGIVMLIIYGFQYAAEDKNVATFSALKTKITGVVLGLMLLLGIFVILRTINPDLLIVEPEIAEITFIPEERANNPEFIQTIGSIDTSTISGTLGPIDPAVLMYLMHQQGPSGSMAIVWSATRGYSSVPSTNPFTRSNINKNMRGNIGSDFASVSGSTAVTPKSFLVYWQKKILALKANKTRVSAPVEEALVQASGKTGIPIDTLRAICKIESAGCIPTKTNGSYKGLFQLSNDVFRQYVSNGDIFNPTLNAYAGARYGQDNLKFAHKYWYKITQ